MKILVINSGSSSLKFSLIDTKKSFSELANGHIDGISLPSCIFIFKKNRKETTSKIRIKDHREAIKLALDTLLKNKTIKDLKEIDAIGHRVVHGGEKYTSPAIIDQKVINTIKYLCKLAPLHNPANLTGILACKTLLPKTPQVAIFDTAFHQTMPEKAYLYALPYSFYKKHNIRRYGFHGTSHKYVIGEALKLLKKKNAKIISCHIGNGSSITASLNGKSVDTSMGLTPLEGIMMGTRSGSIDPAIIFHLEKTLKLSPNEVYRILNEKSGLLGVSEISSDMRKIYTRFLKKDPKAIRAIDLLSYQIAKYLGSYASILGGIHGIIFTGGLGEKAFYVREKACSYLKFLGLTLDPQKNKKCEKIISTRKSKIKVFVIPTNEEKQIAIETQKIIKK
ncbi:MAG: acetate kinase [Candidatus Gracilibacteria bacterium]|jgi:acetate kinase